MKFAPPISHTVTSVTNRKEHHGEELKLAVSIKFNVKGTAQQIIDPFSTTMRLALFNNEPGFEHLAKFAELRKFDFNTEFKDCLLVLGDPEDGDRYKEVTLKDFTFEVADGGVVELAYTASFPVESAEIGPLAERIKEPCMVQFTTPIDMVQKVEHEPAEA
jgi:hypothetical protein